MSGGDISRLVRWFEEAEGASQDARAEGEKARDYYDSKQYTAEELATLQVRKQPIVWENLIRPKVDYLRGLERQSRTQPRALPRSTSRADDAFSVSDALQYVASDQFLDIKRSIVFENMMVEGYGGIEVAAHRARGGIDPQINSIAWNRLFFDPHSSQPDFSDSRYKGFITWMDEDEARDECEPGGKWEGKASVIDATMAEPVSSAFASYDDKPRWSAWGDASRKRIRIVTIYFRQRRVWHRAVYTLGGELEPAAPSPWLDEDGNPECGLILQAAYIDSDNDRYGLCRDMIPLQDEVNKRRSKFMHHVSSRAVRVGSSSTQDAEEIRKEAARPDGVIVADQGDVEFIPNNDMASGQFQLLADTRASLKGMGPNAHLQGKDGADQSGRAILALQQGGMVEMAPLLDALRHFNIRVYRAIWNRIRQFWTEERWVRVTDDERNVRFVGFNVTKLAVAIRKVEEALREGKIDQATAVDYIAQLNGMPELRAPANVIAELDVDIDIDEVADSPALHMEQFNDLVKLAAMAPDKIPLRMIVEASSLRDKAKLLKLLDEAEAAQAQPNPAQELAAREAQARVARTESEAAFIGARAEHETAKPLLRALELGTLAA